MSDDKKKARKSEPLVIGATKLHVGHSLALNPVSGPEPLPQSKLLGRLASFLPKLGAANEELEKQLSTADDPSALHVDHVEDEDEPHIEMNVALGELDPAVEALLCSDGPVGGAAAAAAAEDSDSSSSGSSSGSSSSSSDSDGSSSSGGSSSDEDEADGKTGKHKARTPPKPRPSKRTKVLIEEIP